MEEQVKEVINGQTVWFNKDTARDAYLTYDASIFKRLLGNRSITASRKKKVYDSIKSIGLLPIAIIVNENLEIIDGQARVEVFNHLGLPILYRIVPGLGIDECIALNRYLTAWDCMDFIRCYAEMGDASYLRLLNLINSHKILSLTDVMCAVTGIFGVGNARKQIIEPRKLELGKGFSQDVNDMLDYVEQFKLFIEELKNRKTIGRRFPIGSLYQVLCYAYRFDNVDNDHLLRQFKVNYDMWRGREANIEALNNLSDIYNYKTKKELRLNFFEEHRQMKDIRKEKWSEGSWRKHLDEDEKLGDAQ